ncbi:Mut7-C RNAse domain-containing protein [Candidatus Micrarchaeota archaeon]|nr:Mut7-C RNAse domain-containing protein [Candidatus Micrarchaeota archaeon]
MKLLLDSMLARTARWLRVFGVDTLYLEVSDDELILTAENEGAVLITRDKKLSEKAKNKVKILLVESTDFKEQIKQIVSSLGIELRFPEGTRCPGCNFSLRMTKDKKEVEGKVPDSVFRLQKEFWICDLCGKIYWRGGHWENIGRIFSSLEI